MHYSAIKYNDIANGTGVRTVLFVSGCRNHCKECFQPETWDFKNGEEFTKEVEDEILASLESPYIKGLTLLGGDPFEPENQHALLPFIKRVRTVDGPYVAELYDITLKFKGSSNQRVIDCRKYNETGVIEELM